VNELDKKPLFEVKYEITGIDEFGSSFEELLQGKLEIPKEGFRANVWLKGEVTGPEVEGIAEGADYLYVRADGRMQLDVKVTLTTKDGKKIAFTGEGVALPQPDGVIKLEEYVTLFSSHPEYAHLNSLGVWGVGTSREGKIHIKCYSQL
jgi:hypothetical protein